MNSYFSRLISFSVLFCVCIFDVFASGNNASIMITNAHILTMDEQKRILTNGVVVIKDDIIVAVGTKALLRTYNAKKVINAQNGIVMPGMVNTHNHLPMIAFRGLGEEGIENRLFAYFFPLEKEKLSRAFIYNATYFGVIDLARGGITTYVDMYYHMDEMARATKKVGLRAVLGQTVIQFPVVDAQEPYGGIEYAKTFIAEYKNDPLITPAFAPHAPYTVSEEKLQEIHNVSNKLEVPVLIHAAEFPKEPERIKTNAAGLSTIAWLNSIGFLDDRVLLAHVIHADANDMRIIKQTRAGVSYNPMANAKGATGIAPAWEMYKQHIPMGLGTDGPMSSNQVDIWRVLSYASSMQRLRHKDRTIMTPRQVIELATMGGARAINMDSTIGSLEVGKKADIIIIETKSSNMKPNYNPYATLVYQANPSNVVTTIVNGRIIMEDRVMQTIDMKKAYEAMNAIEADVGEFAKELAKKAKRSKSTLE